MSARAALPLLENSTACQKDAIELADVAASLGKWRRQPKFEVMKRASPLQEGSKKGFDSPLAHRADPVRRDPRHLPMAVQRHPVPGVHGSIPS